MSDNILHNGESLIELTSSVVAAYVSHNHVAHADIPGVIATVHRALVELMAGGAKPEEKARETPNASQIRRSVQPDRIISFIDGKPYKTLKRHLTANGLTPATYRERFGLAPDYPMVAPEYSERRSSLAKSYGLGAGTPGEASDKRRVS